jgi:hypothetical protein
MHCAKLLSASVAEADPFSFDLDAIKESDLKMIRVGTKGYEIPDAVSLGG